jgi:hypothetical protein
MGHKTTSDDVIDEEGGRAAVVMVVVLRYLHPPPHIASLLVDNVPPGGTGHLCQMQFNFLIRRCDCTMRIAVRMCPHPRRR